MVGEATPTRSRNVAGAILFRSTNPGTAEILLGWWNHDSLDTFSVALAPAFEGVVVFALLRKESARAEQLLPAEDF